MKYSFKDIFDVSSGLSKKRSEFGMGSPFVSFKDVFGNPFLPDILSQLAKTDKKEQQRHSVEEGDLFLTRTSEKFEELAMSSVALKTYPEATFNGFTKRLRLKPEYRDSFDIKYIAYFARSNIFRNQVLSMTTMSTRASLNNEMISRLFISAPSKNIQQIISAILYTLDSKIELNKQIISTLEELASTLFKRWFVDFEFPDENGNPYKSSGGEMVDSELGEIPERFHVSMLSEIAEIVGGGTPSKKIEEYYLDGKIPWITPKDLSINKDNFVGRGKVSITELGLKKSSAKIIPKNSILFSSRAPIGYVAIAKNEVCTNQGFKSLVPNNEIPFQFIFLFMKNNISKIESIATGSTFKEISGSAMKSYKLVLPVEELLKHFDTATIALFGKIDKCEEENRKLIRLRDALLPKLLSGEIEIPQSEDV
ncbi:restriction endonuclease subunit S [Carnobacterium maltaromaticum]